MNLKTPIIEVEGIGESHSRLLEKLGICTIEDFLLYLPRRWDDFSNILLINQIRPGEKVSIKAKVARITNRRVKGTLNLTEAIVSDESGLLKVVWFNQPFLTKNIHVDDEIFLSGVVEFSYGSIQMTSPTYEKVSFDDNETIHTGRIVPVYPETAGITSKWIRGKIQPLMKYMYSIKDYLPESVKSEQNLIDLPAAIRQMHFPENESQLEKANERIDFDEMFLLQAAVLNSKKQLKTEKAIATPINDELIKSFVQNLGFDLTVAQRKSAWDILQDCAKDSPMNRLLQGDVGSGKTVVAAIALLNTAISGSQAALLCPTEILAKQHYAKISGMMKPFEIECAILTGATRKEERDIILARLKEGEIKIIIGTHALLEKNVEFWRLGLAIVDEQHRFGVEQRGALRKESISSGTIPHFLAMTATPIPRTLSLTIYGDLDVSIIYELPPGRQKIITRIVPEEKRLDAYVFIKKEINRGGQVYVVCTLVEQKIQTEELTTEDLDQETLSDIQNKIDTQTISKTESSENERKSVLDEYGRLSRKVFPDVAVDYIHGQMKTSEKELAMSKFVNGTTKVLVCSSIIEVGLDVPSATIIIVEDAERFGLAQLHQFRGRVGRGSKQSYCLLFSSSKSEIAKKRLEALVLTDNGFKLADTDLEIRGPGDFIGGRQHGLPDIKMKNMMDIELIKRCREAAKRFVAGYEVKNYPLLVKNIDKYKGVLTLE